MQQPPRLKFSPFNPEGEETWESYEYRLRQTLDTMRIWLDADKKRSFIPNLDALMADTIRHALYPRNLNTPGVTFETMMAVLGERFSETPQSVVAAEQRFLDRVQGENESVAAWYADLQSLAVKCQIPPDSVRGRVKTQLIRGTKDPAAKAKLLRKADVSLERALEILKSFEAARGGTQASKPPSLMINQAAAGPPAGLWASPWGYGPPQAPTPWGPTPGPAPYGPPPPPHPWALSQQPGPWGYGPRAATTGPPPLSQPPGWEQDGGWYHPYATRPVAPLHSMGAGPELLDPEWDEWGDPGEEPEWDAAVNALGARPRYPMRREAPRRDFQRAPRECSGCLGDHNRRICPYWRTTCHACGERGHIARACPEGRSDVRGSGPPVRGFGRAAENPRPWEQPRGFRPESGPQRSRFSSGRQSDPRINYQLVDPAVGDQDPFGQELFLFFVARVPHETAPRGPGGDGPTATPMPTSELTEPNAVSPAVSTEPNAVDPAIPGNAGPIVHIAMGSAEYAEATGPNAVAGRALRRQGEQGQHKTRPPGQLARPLNIPPPLTVDICIEGTSITMEIDTGAGVSIVGEPLFRQHWPKHDVYPSSIRLRALAPDPYPVTTLDEAFAGLAQGKIFTKLDLEMAYSQLPVTEDTAQALTIATHRGLYRVNRLAFGVATAPAIFQRVIDNLLRDLPNVVVLLDDILIAAPTPAELALVEDEVLRRLSSKGLKLKWPKCEFGVPAVQYLGHEVSAEGHRDGTERAGPPAASTPTQPSARRFPGGGRGTGLPRLNHLDAAVEDGDEEEWERQLLASPPTNTQIVESDEEEER